MKLIFDARMYGLSHAGIGRYVKNITTGLARKLPSSSLSLITHPDHQPQHLPATVHQIPTPARHYTLKEQLLIPRLLQQLSPDLVHFPHFNVPLSYHRPFVVTIHDLLWHQVKGSAVTTLPPLTYHLKYLGYRLVVRHALNAAKAVITPSQWVKDQLVRHFPHLDPTKVHVIYEGADPSLQPTQPAKPPSKRPYFIYVGSAYPHKNIPALFDALAHFRRQYSTPPKLIIVSARSVFLDRLTDLVRTKHLSDLVDIKVSLSDARLAAAIKNAVALIQPSLSEGFGLTGLEAMQLGTPVLSSRYGALPEIYSHAALYIDARRPPDIARQLHRLMADPSLRQQLITQGKARARQFSWDKAVDQTIALYQQVHQRP